jgi:hypothetical protein
MALLGCACQACFAWAEYGPAGTRSLHSLHIDIGMGYHLSSRSSLRDLLINIKIV